MHQPTERYPFTQNTERTGRFLAVYAGEERPSESYQLPLAISTNPSSLGETCTEIMKKRGEERRWSCFAHSWMIIEGTSIRAIERDGLSQRRKEHAALRSIVLWFQRGELWSLKFARKHKCRLSRVIGNVEAVANGVSFSDVERALAEIIFNTERKSSPRYRAEVVDRREAIYQSRVIRGAEDGHSTAKDRYVLASLPLLPSSLFSSCISEIRGKEKDRPGSTTKKKKKKKKSRHHSNPCRQRKLPRPFEIKQTSR
ncbi:unnamed protein product, partial [Heterotrigona itama]